MAIAPLDKLIATSMGSISGVKPTATAKENIRALIKLPLEKKLIAQITTTKTSMARIISHVNRLIPWSKLLGILMAARRREISPNWVASPVLKVTPNAVPLTTLEPIKAMLLRSVAAGLVLRLA